MQYFYGIKFNFVNAVPYLAREDKSFVSFDNAKAIGTQSCEPMAAFLFNSERQKTVEREYCI